MIDYFAVWQQINEHILKDPNTFKAVFPKEPGYILKTGVLLIILSFVVLAVANYIKNQREEKDSTFDIVLIIIFSVAFIGCALGGVLVLIDLDNFDSYNVQLEMAQKLQKEKSEIERQRQLFKRIIGNKDIKDFYRTSEKIENFCKFYYSPQDSNFCKDNKANKYTFNLIFQKKYENVGDSSDLENAMEYIDKAK